MQSDDAPRDSLASFLRDARARVSEMKAAESNELVVGRWHPAPGLFVFALGGEMDMTNAATFGVEVGSLLPRDPFCVVVDLSAVRFVDSSAIKEFFAVSRAIRDAEGALVLAAPDDHVARVFEIVKMGDAVVVVDSLDEAIEYADGMLTSTNLQPVLASARKGMNEDAFRGVNERLENRALDTSSSGETFEILCECSAEECTERIAISFADYEAVRTNPKAFIVVLGHGNPSHEEVVAAGDGYEVVEKFGTAGMVAEIGDPRAPTRAA